MRILPTLMPDLTGLTVIGGGGAGDRSYMARFRQVFESMALPYEFSYMSGLTSDELINALKALPPDNAIVMTTYDRDDQGNLLRTLQITETVATEVDRPVLVMSDNLLSTGALGGNVSTVAGYALTAASLVANILRGLFPDDPVTARTQFKFNGQALDRFAVNRDSLPVGSQIVFDQPNLAAIRHIYHCRRNRHSNSTGPHCLVAASHPQKTARRKRITPNSETRSAG